MKAVPRLLVVALLVAAGPVWGQSPAEEPAVRAVQKVLPAVVNIYTERTVTVAVRDPLDEFYERFFGGAVVRGNRLIRQPVRNLGSGLLVSASGYIVTNQHVVERAADVKIQVTLSDGKDYEAKLVRADEDLDLALIRIVRKEPFPFLDLSKLSPNLLGQSVLAIGNPIGYESSVSRGILSAKERTLTFEGISMEGLLQTDAAINPGNSGGPLVDLEGNLVGINSAKMAYSRNVTVENIGFAIPGDRVKAFVEESIAIAEGRRPAPPEVSLPDVLRKRFGLDVQDLTPALARNFGYPRTQGLLVSGVEAGSPAAEAGIEPGMVVVAVGSQSVRTVADLPRMLVRVKTGETVRFTLVVPTRQGNFMVQRVGSVQLPAR
jgi:serine protease Do